MSGFRLDRRRALAAMSSTLFASSAWQLFAADPKRRFKIGACDWSIQRRGDPTALQLARQIGLDGVEVSFGRPGDAHDLRVKSHRDRYLAEADTHGVEICSLAMGVLNEIPYATSPEAQRWVDECIEVMPLLNQRIVLLAFFAEGDLKHKPDLQDAVIARLKQAAPKAEAAGVVLGVESYLNADEHLRILDAVDSPSVQVYYDVANMEHMGYDVYREIRQLGRERICQIHCKENGFLLGEGKIDFSKVKEAIDEINWQGWLVIEGAVPSGGELVESYVKNQQTLRRIFPTE